MKKIGLFLIISLIALGYGVYDFVQKAPADLYQKAIKGQIGSSWFSNQDFSNLIEPEFKKVELRNVQTKKWWKLVQLDVFKFPLPYRNPLFRVAPIFPDNENQVNGLTYLDNHKQEILMITYNRVSYFTPRRLKHKFYTVPLVDHLTSQYKVDQIWNDIFTKKVSHNYQDHKQAIKDLFLLEQRRAFLGDKMVSFGVIEKQFPLFFIELKNNDKDYIWERFFIKDHEKIYSFDLKTFRQSESAKTFRSFILHNMKVLKDKLVNDALAYARFQSLNKEAQEDEVGFIHLFSAWSQIEDGEQYIKEMVYYAERSENLKHILPKLYEYSFYKYKKLFAHHKDIYIEVDSHLELQRQIEIERKKTLGIRVNTKDIKPKRKTLKSTIRKKIDNSKQAQKKTIYRVN